MPSGYFSLILRGHASSPRDEAALLEGTGISTDALSAGVDITLGQQLCQIRNAVRVLDPGWSLEAGTRLTAVTHGALSFAAVCAPSLLQGLQAMRRFSYLRAPHTELHILPENGDGEVRLLVEDRVALSDDESHALLDIVMLSNQALIETQLGRPMYEGRFEFPYAAPEHAGLYRDLFHAPVRFGCPEAAIVIPAQWLTVESPFADLTLYKASVERLYESARRFEGDRRLVARVEQILAQRGARMGSSQVARLLGISERTLTRRLGAQGTSFRELTDETLKSRAVALLQDEELTVAEIAYALGYEDPANFGRAFRRWFSESPGRFRSNLDRESGDTGGSS
jgi:AraC-like DNA-binding protein